MIEINTSGTFNDIDLASVNAALITLNFDNHHSIYCVQASSVPVMNNVCSLFVGVDNDTYYTNDGRNFQFISKIDINPHIGCNLFALVEVLG